MDKTMCSDLRLAKIADGHSFTFKSARGECRCWHEKGVPKFACSLEAGPDFEMLVRALERLERRSNELDEIDLLEEVQCLARRTQVLNVYDVAGFMIQAAKMRSRIMREWRQTKGKTGTT
jgi:hypothetical protein